VGIDPEAVPGQSSSVVVALFCWNFWGTTSPIGAKIEGGGSAAAAGWNRSQTIRRNCREFFGVRPSRYARVCQCASVPVSWHRWRRIACRLSWLETDRKLAFGRSCRSMVRQIVKSGSSIPMTAQKPNQRWFVKLFTMSIDRETFHNVDRS
jgi:hypothetical protein